MSEIRSTWPLRVLIVTAALAVVVVLCVVMPPHWRMRAGRASGDGETGVIRLMGLAVDHQATHPDFQATPAGGYGPVAELVGTTLGDDGRPVHAGPGRRVDTPARDAAGRVIAPHLANETFSCGITNFTIAGGQVVPAEPFAAMLSVLGSAITSDGVDIPVTVQVRIGENVLEPFGPYAAPGSGDVNDHTNPRHFIPPATYAAGSAITVASTSWMDGSVHMAANSLEASPYVLVLRDGDAVPDIDPFDDQAAIATFLDGYVDAVAGQVTLEANQAIFLFELGTTNLSAAAADFQDLVVLITLARDADDLTIPGSTSTAGLGDDPAVLGAADDAAIDSAVSFAQWFRPSTGVSVSVGIPLILRRDSSGPGVRYVFDDLVDQPYLGRGGFYPLDGRGFGNTSDPHNHHFTYRVAARFTYDASANQYFLLETNGDAWVFIDDRLAIDLGGVHATLDQRIDLDRLCLVDGERSVLSFFLAERFAPESRLRIETNLELEGVSTPPISAQFD
jgi:fibro-slime domain-containing protein